MRWAYAEFDLLSTFLGEVPLVNLGEPLFWGATFQDDQGNQSNVILFLEETPGVITLQLDVIFAEVGFWTSGDNVPGFTLPFPFVSATGLLSNSMADPVGEWYVTLAFEYP